MLLFEVLNCALESFFINKKPTIIVGFCIIKLSYYSADFFLFLGFASLTGFWLYHIVSSNAPEINKKNAKIQIITISWINGLAIHHVPNVTNAIDIARYHTG